MTGWTVHLDELVLEKDLPGLDQEGRRRIFVALRKKLMVAPEAFGIRLSGEYRGYWRLKVDIYRLIYRIDHADRVVKVVKVGNRRDDEVYDEFLKRLKR